MLSIDSRYADVVVHRQLQAALEGAGPCYPSEEVALQASQCNERKHAAKNAQVTPLVLRCYAPRDRYACFPISTLLASR